MDTNKKPSDLVSVIVPFLNGSEWLTEALESVINQTYTNWEVIVFDDGSDETHSLVARNFCHEHPNKMFYTEHAGHVNKGVSVSRNEAAKLAHGKYLAFLDADDVWMPAKLANQLALFCSHPAIGAVFGAFIRWYSWQDENAADEFQPIGAPAEICYAPGTLLKLLYPFFDAASPAPSGIMIKKETFDNIHGFEPFFSGIYELYEDQAFLSKLYLHETVFVYKTADIMYRKRQNSMSSAANNMERYHKVRAFYLDWLEGYLGKQNIEDDEIFCLIEKARLELIKKTSIT